jgi:hypothetical protein
MRVPSGQSLASRSVLKSVGKPGNESTDFFSIKVQEYLMKFSIQFRPIKPGAPHLNGKVERSQRTDLDEIYLFICNFKI